MTKPDLTVYCGEALHVRVRFEDHEADYIFRVSPDGVGSVHAAPSDYPPVQTPQPAAGAALDVPEKVSKPKQKGVSSKKDSKEERDEEEGA